MRTSVEREKSPCVRSGVAVTDLDSLKNPFLCMEGERGKGFVTDFSSISTVDCTRSRDVTDGKHANSTGSICGTRILSVLGVESL